MTNLPSGKKRAPRAKKNPEREIFQEPSMVRVMRARIAQKSKLDASLRKQSGKLHVEMAALYKKIDQYNFRGLTWGFCQLLDVHYPEQFQRDRLRLEVRDGETWLVERHDYRARTWHTNVRRLNRPERNLCINIGIRTKNCRLSIEEAKRRELELEYAAKRR